MSEPTTDGCSIVSDLIDHIEKLLAMTEGLCSCPMCLTAEGKQERQRIADEIGWTG